MEKEYKIEMKPSWWHVTLMCGCYSDYREHQLFFAANDEWEVWNFLQRYMDDVAKEDVNLWGLKENGTTLAMKWNDEKYLSVKFTGDRDGVDWEPYDDGISTVTIKRLHVIHFRK